jgi:Tol biopolymer transport system component
VWSADGRLVAYQSDREGDRAIFSQLADGSGMAVRLTTPGVGASHTPESWSPDGRTLLFSISTSASTSLATLAIGDWRVVLFSDIRSVIPADTRFSPDGRWIVYARANRGAASAVYVEPFPATGAKYQLLVEGPPAMAHKPVWSSDGRELLYVPRLGGFEAVRVTTHPTFGFGKPVTVPRHFNPGAPSIRALYDVMPRDRFVGVVPLGDSSAIYAASKIEVVLHWFDDLRHVESAR